MHTIYLALGSNIGNTTAHLTHAIEALTEKLTSIKAAPFYRSKPMYYEAQDDFLNTVIKGETDLTPQALLTYVKQLEKTLGRQQRFRNGPREIDIDILFYDNLIMETELLTIPHPRIQERIFVLEPFMNLAPEFVHPLLKKRIDELWKGLPRSEDNFWQ